MNDELLTRKELAARMKTSERKIARMEKDGLPVLILGNNTKRYDYNSVIAFIQEMNDDARDVSY